MRKQTKKLDHVVVTYVVFKNAKLFFHRYWINLHSYHQCDPVFLFVFSCIWYCYIIILATLIDFSGISLWLFVFSNND